MLKPTTRMSLFCLLTLIGASLFTSACTGPTEGIARGEALYNNCKTCHAADGSGNPVIKAPAIAGLPAWYIENQINSYQKGGRGLHFDDIPGMRMRPMALSLLNQRAFLPGQFEKLSVEEKTLFATNKTKGEANLKEVAAFIAAMPPLVNKPTLTGGNPAKGKTLYTVCATCHAADGMGMKVMNAPPIAGGQDWYIVDQLNHFKSGIRGTASGDTFGATMAPMAKTLTTDQDVLDVAAYIVSLPRKTIVPASAK